MLDAISRALSVYTSAKDAWYKVIYNGMIADFTWNNSANEYMELYKRIKENA